MMSNQRYLKTKHLKNSFKTVELIFLLSKLISETYNYYCQRTINIKRANSVVLYNNN